MTIVNIQEKKAEEIQKKEMRKKEREEKRIEKEKAKVRKNLNMSKSSKDENIIQ